MKKLSILLLAIFYIGIANVSAQTETQPEGKIIYEEGDKKIILAEETKECAKTGKVCDVTCEKKKNGTCCKGKKVKKGSFNFNKSNNYTKKSSCSKSAKKTCCKKKTKKCGADCTKACCAKTNTDELEPLEELPSKE